MPQGLSPRVRGNPVAVECVASSTGSIPACAGEPPRRDFPTTGKKVYPRVCGGTVLYMYPGRLSYGLSPRVRGNHQSGWLAVLAVGSIPACAGEPTRS